MNRTAIAGLGVAAIPIFLLVASKFGKAELLIIPDVVEEPQAAEWTELPVKTIENDNSVKVANEDGFL